MKLGENIRYLRIKQGLSQDYIAEKLGYKSYTTIQKWESGVSEPPIKKLKELSVLLNADMNDMANKDLTLEETNITTRNKDPQILQYYNQLNDIGRHEATKRVEELTYIPQYRAGSGPLLNAAHSDNYDTASEELKQLEEDIMDDENF